MADGIEVEQIQIIESRPKKMPMVTSMDRETIREAYEDVRSNLTDTEWAVFKFESSEIVCAAKGIGFEDFQQQFMDDERAFGYIRIQMGDEMSKRSKFLFLTWIGCDVGVMQRAKMSTDKSIMKEVISNFAAELQIECEADMDLIYFKEVLQKAQGANYGTGIREI
ncbi:coactosin-like protein [Chironomus tepperi]|uniref:coactosin-like protein n=1 Tax=Chironomus tepperi TaxID=113505 RepID=UPI00391F696C